MSNTTERPEEGLQHLKQVSRVKHVILEKYLPAWQTILGSISGTLNYVDCYAGPGVYDLEGKKVEGSPVIAVRAAKNFLAKTQSHVINLLLVENSESQRASLEAELKKHQPYGEGLNVYLLNADAKDYLTRGLANAKKLAPSFFFVDPYGHPLTIPILKEILAHPRQCPARS